MMDRIAAALDRFAAHLAARRAARRRARQLRHEPPLNHFRERAREWEAADAKARATHGQTVQPASRAAARKS